uniref:Monodehydroascorbate reductase n=1 Tax=Tanacetum cinerariifolium TaxID=118510 RepID=A0A699IE13_TANCI|nr:hypothetical protein [Tanacetum cinerariifolium]
MNNKKHIANLEYFRKMLHICPRLPNQTFDELLFEEEILAFLRYLGHSGEIKKITDVNINKLHQPWRSFAAVINKCLSGKSTGYDSLQLSQAQILWGMYHKKNVDFAYIPWEDFVYQVEHKYSKKSIEMYYPRVSGVKLRMPSLLIRNSILSLPRALMKMSANDNDDDQDTDNDGDDFVHPKLSIHEEEAKYEESFDPIVQRPENSDDEGNDDASLGMNVGGKEGQNTEDEDEELYRDVNINLEGRDVQMTDVHTTQEFEDTHVTLTLVNPNDIDSLFELTPWVDVQASTTVAPLTLTAPTFPPPTIPTISQTLEANFSEFVQTNQFARVVSSILGIVKRYIDQRMNEAVKVAVQIQSDRLRDEAQAKNKEFLNKLDENIQKIIKEQLKEQVKTSYAVAADLSEMELKKILIEKKESNKSIHRSDEQMNLYKSLVDAYEYKDEEPSAGTDWGSKRRREGKEPTSTSAPKEKATKTTGKSTEGSKSHQKTASESAPAVEPMQKTQDLEEPSHQEFQIATHESIQPWISYLAKQANSRSSFNELMDTPVDFSAFLMNRLKVDTLTPELLAGPTYELMKGSCKSLQYPHNLLKPLPLIPNSRGLRVIPFDHFINNDLEYLCGGASSRKYTTSVTKTKVTDYRDIKWIEDLVPRTTWSQELITVRRDDNKLYKFKEGDFKRLRIQDIEDMLLLMVQGKLTNLTVEERFAFNVSLRMFTRSIVIQRRVEDLQLGVESYQKKLNLTKLDTYRSDLKRKEA